MTRHIKDHEFALVEAGSLCENACSPEFGLDEIHARGIRIHAPARVAFTPGDSDARTGAFAHVVICGACHFDAHYLGLAGGVVDRLLFVAFDVEERRVYAGRMEAVPDAAPVPILDEPPLIAADYAGRSMVEYFNPNLATVLGLPEREADYVVFATIGTHISNVVRIAVRQEE